MGLFSRGGECPRCMRVAGACICNRPTKVTSKGLKPVKPRRGGAAKPKGGPHVCGRTDCRAYRDQPGGCPSVVRGGVCPCRFC